MNAANTPPIATATTSAGTGETEVSGGVSGKKWKLGLGVAVVALGLLALLAGIFGGGGDGVMPLDDSTMEKYKAAREKAEIRLSDNICKMPPAVASAMIFRKTVQDLGYDPDKSLLKWLSPEYETELHKTCDTKDELLSNMLMAGMLIQKALGEEYQPKDEEFAKVLELYSPDAQTVAQTRRDSRK